MRRPIIPIRFDPNTKPFPNGVLCRRGDTPDVAWLLNEGAGRLVNESILGLSSSSSSTNEPTWVEGFAGPAMHFVSSSAQWVGLPKEGLVSSGPAFSLNPFTISVRWRSTASGTVERTLYTEESLTNSNPYLILDINNGVNGRVTFSCGNDSGATVGNLNYSGGLADGKWHMLHIVNRARGSTDFLFYVEGIQRVTGSLGIPSTVSTAVATIGADRYSGTPADLLDGDIDFVMLWNRALNVQEIQYHFRNPYASFISPRLHGSYKAATAAVAPHRGALLGVGH
jgi:hypothetical protein